MNTKPKVITKKQSRDIQKKKILKIAIPSALFLVAIISFIVIKFFVNTAMMDPQVNFTYGDCQYRSAENSPWETASVGMNFSSDYVFKTGPGGMMDLLLQDRSVVRITQNTELSVRSLNARTIELSMRRGTLYGKIKKLYSGQRLRVKDRTVVASVRGTEFCTETGISSTAGYCVGGSIEVASVEFPEKKQIVAKNTKSNALPGVGPGNAEKMSLDEIKEINDVIRSIKLYRMLLVTSNLLFEPGSADLTDAMKGELNTIYEGLKDVDGIIMISGHTDNTGEPGINLNLSFKRATAIKEFLAQKGIDRNQLSAEGRGDAEPIAPNTTPEGRRKNRRVEFVLLK